MKAKKYQFTAKIWRFSSDSTSWFFVWLPDVMSAEIKTLAKEKKIRTKGFAFVPVEVRVGTSLWNTTLFPNKDKPYLLSVNKKVRLQEALFEGEVIEVSFKILS